ncbi:MAG: IS1595 family transposase [Proteobacteria bacterium]|nr:IS1595 family transposase [Pseudomonadota bacterium]
MKYTFKQFKAEYPDDAACLNKIMDMRYGRKEASCPSCGADTKFHRIAKRRAYACQHCGHHVYPCVGTPFEKSRTALSDWFFAMYLMTTTRHGVAAKELERQLGVTYKTAWRMARELRKHMANADDHGPLSGHVEIDETYVGGRRPKIKGFTGRGAKGKTVVFGMLERGGSVRAGPVPNVRRKTLQPLIFNNVIRGSTISTDEFGAYNTLGKAPYRHGRVNHSADEWVRGIHHVNSIEGYWSRLKNSIKGTHVHVSPKHLWAYVAEFSFRYNMRKQPALMFNLLVASLSLPRIADG